ncbi:PAS domain-containing sensor histidine kinase [Caballeronia novacaledonica]|uniref:histidine kinase n=1 Tax=Caballeronia novacaledonica TaxID=1544861 RepID=A0AA37MTZ5_9BURK|nr:PAS domain-containing sensor histidine kinase [Caballeronia novacaledonica]GJH28349.1 PAS domain-containing sensor histidine kinase [Caballeronia novacaledonica]
MTNAPATEPVDPRAPLSPSLQTDASFRLLVEAVEDYAIFLLDAHGNVATWNNGAKRIKGYDAREIVGRHFSVFYPPEDIAAGKPQSELAIAAQAGRVEDEGWRIRKDASRFWANVVITALHDAHGNLLGFAKVTRDMTDRLRLTELQHARELSAHVQSALENERASIARELHDDLGQQLAALKMQISLLDTGAHDAHIATQSLAQIDTIIGSVRRIAAGLRPPVLDDLGLFAAIDWLACDFRRRYDLTIHLDLEGEEDGFDTTASTSVFRLVQEALTNIVRHARASEARIAIVCAQSRCTLTIEDDGCGADVTRGRAAGAFGLLGMGERVRQLGGVIAFRSAPGEGFRIRAEIPLGHRAGDGFP